MRHAINYFMWYIISFVYNSGSAADLALFHVAPRGHISFMQYLITEKGANVNSQDWYETTALHMSVGNTNSIKFLLENGADINSKNVRGHTALYYAAGFGNLDSVKLLLEEGADINADDEILTYMYTKFIDRRFPELTKRITENFGPILKLLIEKEISLAPIAKALQENGIKFTLAQQSQLQELIAPTINKEEPLPTGQHIATSFDNDTVGVLVEELGIVVE